MSHVERHVVDVTTDGAGDGTGYVPVRTGHISQIRYVKDATTPYANGVDFSISLEATGEAVWVENNVNASAERAPRQATHKTDGTYHQYAVKDVVYEQIALDEDRVKIVVSSGGANTTGRFYVVIGCEEDTRG